MELGDAIAAGDSARASALVGAFFADGAPAVDRLFQLLASDTSEGEVAALAALLKAATHLLEHEPGRLAPRRLDDVVEQCIALLGAGDHVPRVLHAGLDAVGAQLAPRHVLGLLEAFTTRDLGPAFESQVPCLGLARLWAREMSRDVELALLGTIGTEGTTDALRGQAAALLLERDWRRFAPELVSLAAGLRERGALAGDEAAVFTHLLASRAFELASDDRAAYFATFAADPEVSLALAGQMNSADARLALEVGATEPSAARARELLHVRAGGAEALASGQGLLAGAHSDPGLERFVLGNWLATDLAHHPDVQAWLGARFEARHAAPARFWSSLGHDLAAREDHELAASVLPWLERSVGERDPTRLALLSAVRQRLPGVALE